MDAKGGEPTEGTAAMVDLDGPFTEGMIWVNQGKWHIDHIRSCASFDLADPERQRLSFLWTNLQPLWAAENRAKGAFYYSAS